VPLVIDTAEKTRSFATPRVAAGAFFVDSQDRILLVHTTYKSYRDIPGGYIEVGEDPRSACVREVREELGLNIDLGPLLVVDWAPNPTEGDKILFIFDGGILEPEHVRTISFPDGEIDGVGFVEDAELDTATIPRLARRLRQAHRARQAGRPLYLQDGVAPA
jgi:8-oxo-dGTP diphosphatase